jgi:CRP-like cAMP-binding protein
MEGIPPASNTDVEDVVWALQTAEALWKRNERGDAIVWLRRAAQAAGEANDDDRAYTLARNAADLTEWLARSPANVSISPTSEPGSSAGVEIDSLLRHSEVDSSQIAPAVPPPLPRFPFATPVQDEATIVPPANDAPDTEPPVPEEASSSIRSSASMRVLSAAESHAGMLDPWSEGEEKKSTTARVEALPAFPLPHRAVAVKESEDEVVTSLAPSPKPSPKPPPPRGLTKPPIPPRLNSPLSASVPPRKSKLPSRLPEARTRVSPPAVPLAEIPTLSTPPTERDFLPTSAVSTPEMPAVEEGPPDPLDLSAVEAFADLPDEAREALARAATLRRYAEGDTIEAFQLAFVVKGDVDVSASAVSIVATTIGPGAVLRSRGTLDEPIPLRLVCASNAVVATWDVDAMQVGLGPCPWVEDDLRASADRVQALAGATLGALGQRLSVELRTSIVERLTIRTFAEHEAIVTEGVSVPGLFLVGAGTVTLVSDDAPPTQVGAGQFVLAAEALSAGASPATVRAAQGGALVLTGDRKTTQELFATEPLLLEIFAGW